MSACKQCGRRIDWIPGYRWPVEPEKLYMLPGYSAANGQRAVSRRSGEVVFGLVVPARTGCLVVSLPHACRPAEKTADHENRESVPF